MLKKKVLVSSFIILLFLPTSSAFVIESGVVIHPNSSASGYYVMDTDIYIEELIVNDTSGKFIGIDIVNRTVTTSYANGTRASYECSRGNYTIPQISDVRHLRFENIPPAVYFSEPSPTNATVYEGKQTITINITSDAILDSCTIVWRGNTYDMTKDGIHCGYAINEDMQAFGQWLKYNVIVSNCAGITNQTEDRYIKIYGSSTGTPSGGLFTSWIDWAVIVVENTSINKTDVAEKYETIVVNGYSVVLFCSILVTIVILVFMIKRRSKKRESETVVDELPLKP